MRGLERMVHQSLVDALTAELTRLGWLTEGGSKPRAAVVYPHELDTGADVAPPAVAVSLGSDGGTTVAQMGGGLRQLDVTFFVDVYGDRAASALHLAGDIRDFLVDSYLHVYDYTMSPRGLTAVEAEVTDVRREAPQVTATAEWRRHWQVVKGNLHLSFEPS